MAALLDPLYSETLESATEKIESQTYGTDETTDDTPLYYMQLNRQWKDSLYPIFLSREDEPKELILVDYIDIEIPDMSSYEFNPKEQKEVDIAIDNIEDAILQNKKDPEYKQLKFTKLCKDSGLKTVPTFKPHIKGNIDISNMYEFEEEIGESIERREIFNTIKSQLILLNTIESADYDIILYLSVHGAIKPEIPNITNNCVDDRYNKDGEKIPGKFPIYRHDPSSTTPESNITFITATIPGTCHIVKPKLLFNSIERFLKNQLSRGTLNLDDLQTFLRIEKRKGLNSYDHGAEQKKWGKDIWDMYAHDIGWRISKNKWLNKLYQKDSKNFGEVPFIILKSSKPVPLNIFDDILFKKNKSHMESRSNKSLIVSKQDLYNYLLDNDFKNILIIDSACAEIWDELTPREMRSVKLTSIRTDVAGGTYKKKKKSTKSNRKNKRKTKRNKHRK